MKICENDVVRSICRESFYEFVKEFWEVVIEEPPVWSWYLKVLCGELQVLAARVQARQPREYDWICNIPPGMTKSTIVSQMFCAWVWTNMPWAQFLCISYSYSIAQKDSLKCRDIVESEKYQRTFPGLRLREDQNTKGLYVNTRKGFRLAAGVGGAVTGHHGHFLLVDDPLNPEQSYSEAELRQVTRWMRQTLPSRRLPKDGAPILLIQQRLSKVDPSGEMLERYAGKGLRHLCLPGELTPDVNPPELRRRYVDGLLDPVRLSREVLAQLRRELGAYGYAGQILQSPVPAEGNLFDVRKLNYATEAPPHLNEVRSWDKAGTPGAGAYTAGVRVGMDRSNRTWIVDVIRGQWGAAPREACIRETAENDGNLPILVEVEGGSGGKESGEATVRNLVGFRVETFHPTGDKVARATPLASQVGAGNVFVLKRHWTDEFVDEMRFFPFSKYKDQVDGASAGFNFLARKRRRVGGLW